MSIPMRTFMPNELNLVEKTLVNGIMAARDGRYLDALTIFEANISRNVDMSNNPLAMSYYGLCMGIIKKKYADGAAICLKALKRNTQSPEAYLNISKILLLQGQKTLAVKALKKGLSFNKTHPALCKEISRLGLRKRPVLSALGRSNPINVLLGKVRAAIA
ncbi:MAG: hypothetical protein KAT46_00850 [Deltaproteobacteria bacterium]|nr:hypothetical protein [Deltaproteobacteria bacterium]